MKFLFALKRKLQNEPIATMAAIVGVVEAVLVLAISFGAPLTKEQNAAILAVVIAAGALVQAVYGRSKVQPLNKETRNAKHKADN
jgi:arginine exporter protein ArgO